MKIPYQYLIDNPWLVVLLVMITALIPLLRMVLQSRYKQKEIGIKQVEVANSIIPKNLHRPSAKQRYLVEQLFSSMYHKPLDFDEIRVLLNYSCPSDAFEKYLPGRKYLKISSSGKSIVLKKKYSKLFEDLKMFSGYFISAIIAAYSAIFALALFNSDHPEPLISSAADIILIAFLALISLLAGFAAYIFIRLFGSIRRAYKFCDLNQ